MEFIKIKQLRKQHWLGQKETAEKLGVSLAAYGRYERGEQNPPPEILLKLADMYNISLDELFDRQFNQLSNADPYDLALETCKKYGGICDLSSDEDIERAEKKLPDEFKFLVGRANAADNESGIIMTKLTFSDGKTYLLYDFQFIDLTHAAQEATRKLMKDSFQKSFYMIMEKALRSSAIINDKTCTEQRRTAARFFLMALDPDSKFKSSLSNLGNKNLNPELVSDLNFYAHMPEREAAKQRSRKL